MPTTTPTPNPEAKPEQAAPAAKPAAKPAKRRTWRQALKVHPWASKFPLIEKDELAVLAADIAQHGLRERVQWTVIKDRKVLVDGRNRLSALELNGEEVIDETDGFVKAKFRAAKPLREEDVPAYIVSANLLRRHLGIRERKGLAREMLKDNPAVSDAKVAAATKTHKRTVRKTRAELEATGEVPVRQSAAERAAAVLAEQPDLSNTEVAKRTGVAEATVRRARSAPPTKASNGAKAPADDAAKDAPKVATVELEKLADAAGDDLADRLHKLL